MKLHLATKIIAAITLMVGTFCLFSGSPTASIGEMEGIGKIVSFKWIGWPYPLAYGAIPYEGGSATETMNRFLFGEGHAYFAVGVWSTYLILSTLLVVFISELFSRFISNTWLRRTA